MMLMVLMMKKKRFSHLFQLKEQEGQQKEQCLHVPGVCITGILFFVSVACVEGSQSSMTSALSHDLSSLKDKGIQSVSVGEPPKGMEAVMQSSNHHHQFLLPIILASVAALTVILSVICIYLFWKRRSRNAPLSKDIEISVTSKGLLLEPIFNRFSLSRVTSKKEELNMFHYATLVSATDDFSENNILGQGGFSSVYRACFSGGNYAAVKKLDGTGQDFEIEFENELDLLSSIGHPNIVSLLGYCINGEQRFLVYELMQNGALDTQLHGPSHGSALTWHIRMKIALDIARGLEYLHEHCSPPIIHRDLKSSNILLDTDFNAKISDFGFAVIGGNHNKGITKLSGTIGYVAPEYLLDGKLTEKSDVYAFGVVLLELLLGRKPVEKISPSQCQSLVTWAMPQLTDRTKLPNIVDPVIRNSMDPKHLYQVAAVTILCVQPEPSYRPLITDVLHSLIPLVPVELGGTLRSVEDSSCLNQKHSSHRK